MSTADTFALPRPRRVALGWAFVERQTNLWKRYWLWEIVWLVYGVVNTLAITFIAREAAKSGTTTAAHVERLTLFLLIGTLVWAYLSAVLDDMALVITWERWEGTIEHTLMAPVSRSVPFFALNFSHADWLAAAVVIAVGSITLIGLGILTGILPMLYPERGEQMSFMVQAVVLLVSGVYYGVDVLPGWLQAVAHASPATYLLRGIRSALLDGTGLGGQQHTLVVLAVFGVVLVPSSLAAFSAAERWARRTGRLKRQG
jgi:ABC-2 type transport system permease protein